MDKEAKIQELNDLRRARIATALKGVLPRPIKAEWEDQGTTTRGGESVDGTVTLVPGLPE